MGSGFYSFEEATSRLGKSKRSIYNYVKKGCIKKTIIDGEVYLNREDVDLLAVDMGSDLPIVNRKTFSQMQIQLQKLQDEMRAVKHALELRDIPPLRPDATSCIGLLQAVQTYLHIEDKATHWTQPFIESWINILEKMDEGTFESMAQASGNKQAWVGFFKFCSEMADFCWSNDKKIPSLKWQELAGKLESVRRNLRNAVVTWIEVGNGSLPPQILEVLGSNKEALISRLAKASPA